jgi:hypothetical protein
MLRMRTSKPSKIFWNALRVRATAGLPRSAGSGTFW